MVQTASPVLGIVFYSLPSARQRGYILHTQIRSVFRGCTPPTSFLWSQVGSVGDIAINLAGKSCLVLSFVFLQGH